MLYFFSLYLVFVVCGFLLSGSVRPVSGPDRLVMKNGMKVLQKKNKLLQVEQLDRKKRKNTQPVTARRRKTDPSKCVTGNVHKDCDNFAPILMPLLVMSTFFFLSPSCTVVIGFF